MAESTKKKKAISKDMPIGQIVMDHPETVEVFGKAGMHCIGCAAAHFENLEQGCAAHGMDADKLVKELNAAVEKTAKEKKE